MLRLLALREQAEQIAALTLIALGIILIIQRLDLAQATFAIASTSMPWVDSSTIRARRQVITHPSPPAHDPHQALSLAVIDLTHPQAIRHRPRLDEPAPAGRLPARACSAGQT